MLQTFTSSSSRGRLPHKHAFLEFALAKPRAWRRDSRKAATADTIILQTLRNIILPSPLAASLDTSITAYTNAEVEARAILDLST